MTVTRGDLAALSLDSYNDSRYPLYLEYESISGPQHFGSGLYVETYQNIKTGEIVIAARGTDLSSIENAWKDITTDIGIGLNKIPSQYLDYKKYVNSIRDEYPGASIYLTGHSKAGAFVQLYEADCILHYYNEHRNPLKAVTFGSPAISGVVGHNWLDEVRGLGGFKALSSLLNISIENCINESDPIPKLTNPLSWAGKVTIFPSNNLSGFDAHSMYNYLITAWDYQTGGAGNVAGADTIPKAFMVDISNNKYNSLVNNIIHSSIDNDVDYLRGVQSVSHKYLLAPDDPAFIDATLSLQDMANGYYLEDNEYGIKWRVTASGRVYPDDLAKYQKQQEYYERLHPDAILGVLKPEKKFKGQVHEDADYVPIASFINNIKTVSSGTDYPDFAAILGEMRDTKINIFEDVASFGVDILKGVIDLAKTEVSILGE